MTDTTPSTGRFGAFNVFATSFGLFTSHFGRLFALAFAPALILTVLNRLGFSVAGTGAPDPAAALVPEMSAATLAGAFAFLVLSIAVGAFMCLVAVDEAIGKRHSVGQYLSQTLRQILPLVVLSLVYGVAMGVAAIFLIVPGLYVAARYFPLVPAIVFENRGWSGLGRAGDLTQGYRWPLVGFFLLVALIVSVLVAVGLALGASFGPAIGGGASFAVEVFANAVGSAYGAAVSATVYLRLREVKEGMGTSQIAATIG